MGLRRAGFVFNRIRHSIWTILAMLAHEVFASTNSTANETLLKNGNDFANNLVSDLGPLLTLSVPIALANSSPANDSTNSFGERFAQQYLSFSTSWVDSFVFATAPLGVLTAIVGAIRVGGPSWLRSLIGRARETRAVAEMELMSSTSHEVCELWNGNSIVRVMGAPRIQQLLYFEGTLIEDNDTTGDGETFQIFTLEDAERRGLLKRKQHKGNKLVEFVRRILKKSLRTLQGSNDEEKGDATHKKGDWHSKKTTVETEIAAPNISLNLSARVGPWEMSAAGVVGLIVQTGVLVFAGLLTYLPGLNTTVGDPSVARYAFPLNALGTSLLVAGMFICASVIEKSTHEERWIKTEKSQNTKLFLIWLQRSHVVGDQAIESTALITKKPLTVIRTSRRQKHYDLSRSSSLMRICTVVGTAVSISGFILQFIGLRGLHWLATMAQLAATLLMTIVRAVLRRGISARPATFKLTSGFELEWLALAMENPKNDRIFGTKYSQLTKEDIQNMPERVLGVVAVNHHWKSPEQDSQQKNGRPLPSRNSSLMSLLRLRKRSRSSQPALAPQTPKVPDVDRVIRIRQRLGQLVQWTGPASDAAVATANAIEATMDILFPAPGEAFQWLVSFYCGIKTRDNQLHKEGEQEIQLSLRRHRDMPKWTMDVSRIEAILSFWLQLGRLSEPEDRLAAHDQEKNTLSRTEWLRRRPRKQNIRFLGRDNVHLRRDIRWWAPDVTMAIWEVRGIRPSPSHEAPSKSKDSVDTIDYNRITGNPTPLRCTTSNSLIPMALELDYKIVELDMFGAATTTVDGRVSDISGALAITTAAPIELQLGQHLFDLFMVAISKRLSRVGGTSTASQTTRTNRPFTWQNFRLQNTVISRLALAIQNTRLSSSLEEAYLCIIPALSQQHKLPVEAAVDFVTRSVEEDENVFNWERCNESYLGLLEGCGIFNSEKCLFTIKARIAVMAYLERIERAQKLVFEDNARLAELKKALEEDAPLKFGDTLDKINLLIKRLYELQNRFHDWSPRGFVEHKARTDSFLGHVGHTQLHRMISEGSIDWEAPAKWSSLVNEQDIFGWAPLHYLIYYMHPPRSSSERGASFISKSIPKLLENGADPNICDISGRTPLHYAALISKKISKVITTITKHLINRGAALDMRDRDGAIPLHYAAEEGDYEFVNMLLRKNTMVQINVRDNAKRTPLHRAVQKKENLAVIQELLKVKASTNIPDFRRQTALHLATVAGDLSYVKALLKWSDREAKDGSGRTAFHLAVSNQHFEVTGYLLDKVDKTTTDSEGQSVMHSACASGNLKMVELLLCHGISPNGIRDDNRTPMHLIFEATYENFSDFSSLVRTLHGHEVARRAPGDEKSHTSVESRDIRGLTPFHIAALNKAMESEYLEVLLQCSAAKTNIPDEDGNTPLHLAIMREPEDVASIDLLLTRGSSDPNLVNNLAETPLHIACIHGHTSIVMRLLRELTAEKFVDNRDKERAEINAKNYEGRTALHLAAKGGYVDIVAQLLQLKASEDITDNKGNTALHLCCVAGRRSNEVAALLLQYIANIDLKNDLGFTALHISIKNRDTALIEVLLARNASLTTATSKGRTAVHLAAKRLLPGVIKGFEIHPEFIQTLDARDKDGNSALHHCHRSYSAEFATALISAGANCDLQNNSGYTPLHVAAMHINEDLVALLLKAGAKLTTQAHDGSTVFHITAEKNNIEEMMLLLRDKRCSASLLNIQRNDGSTALNTTCKMYWVEDSVSQALIEANANKTLPDNDGFSPLHSAAISCNASALSHLLRHGVDMNTTNKQGRTPMHIACIWDNETIVRELLLWNSLASDQVLDCQASLNLQDDYGNTALHYITEELFDIILEYKPDVTIKNGHGRNALHVAVSKGYTVVVQQFSQVNAAMTSQDRAGRTPLFYGIFRTKLWPFFEYLIEAGSDDSEIDAHGWTAALCAVECHHPRYSKAISHAANGTVLKFPGAWSDYDKHPAVELGNKRLEASIPIEVVPVSVLHIGKVHVDYPKNSALVVADHPFSPVTSYSEKNGLSSRYFEIKIINIGSRGIMGIGLCNGLAESFSSMPGWDKGTWGYHGDDGCFFVESGWGSEYAPKYGRGDVVGCGVDLEGKIFFTKNGQLLGTAAEGVFGQLFPTAGLENGSCIVANFGAEPFEYNGLLEAGYSPKES